MANKSALITGITGQDGAFLTKLLLEKGYRVYGLLVGNSAFDNFDNFSKLSINESQIVKVTKAELPRILQDGLQIYNLAGQSSVGKSWEIPKETFEINLMQLIDLLQLCNGKNIKLLQASSVEIYGDCSGDFIDESFPLNPGNPYAISKTSAYLYTRAVRQSLGIFVSNAIFSNHESHLRDSKFITKKIIDYVKAYALDQSIDPLMVGNLNVERDWGYAQEFVQAAYEIMRLKKPDDYIVATGLTFSLRKFIEFAFNEVEVDIEWREQGVNENAINKKNGKKLVQVSKEFYRPSDVSSIQIKTDKLLKATGWKATIKGNQLVKTLFEMNES